MCDQLRSGCTSCQDRSLLCKYPQPATKTGRVQLRIKELERHARSLKTTYAVDELGNAVGQQNQSRARADRQRRLSEHETGSQDSTAGEDILAEFTQTSLPHHHATKILQRCWQVAAHEYTGLEYELAKVFDLDSDIEKRRKAGAKVLEMPDHDLARKLLDVFWSTYGKIYPVLHRPSIEESFKQETWHGDRLTPFRCLLLAIFSCAVPLVLGDNSTYVGRLSAPLVLVDAWLCQASLYGARQQKSDLPVPMMIQQAQFFVWLARRLPCVAWLELAEVSDYEWNSFQHFISHPLLFMRAQTYDHHEVDMDPSEAEAVKRLRVAATDLGLRDDLRFSYLGLVDDISKDLHQILEVQGDMDSPALVSRYCHAPDLTAAGFDSAWLMLMLQKTFDLRQQCNQVLCIPSVDVTTVSKLHAEVIALVREVEAEAECLGGLWAYLAVEMHQYALLLIGRLVLGRQQCAKSDITWSSIALTQLVSERQGLYMDRLLVMDLLLLHTSIFDCLVLAQDALVTTCQVAASACPEDVSSMLDRLTAMAAESSLHHCLSLGFSQAVFRTFAWVLAADKMKQVALSGRRTSQHSLHWPHINDMMKTIRALLDGQAPAWESDDGDDLQEMLRYCGLRTEEALNLSMSSVGEAFLEFGLSDHNDY